MAISAIGINQITSSVPQSFPSLAPALLISMGFIDLGKWLVAIEGGAHFGSSFLLLSLLFNCCGIFCQYLSSCVTMITEKNLVQVYCEEYSWSACLMLGFQAEVSIIVSSMTNILGIAHGLHLLFGIELFKCILLASFIAAIIPFSVGYSAKQNIVLYICISASVLSFYVIGVLIAQPEIPLVMNGMFPRLTAENSYLIMALLGSTIITHNFFIQSSMVQKQRRAVDVGVNSLLHDHFFAILFIFSGTFLANSVLINSATSLFESASFFNVQDVFLLMDQVFRIHMAPLAFLLVVLISGLMAAPTRDYVEKVVIQNFFNIEDSGWISTTCLKSLAILPVIFYAQSSGAEGLYHLLIFCQIVLAMLLPSSVIPLFRVASSRQIMGSYTMSWYLELLALSAFIWMFASNIIFIVELMFGNSSWIIRATGSVAYSFLLLLLFGCVSLCLTFYLIVTPLKSATNEPIIDIQKELLSNQQEFSHCKQERLNCPDYKQGPLGILEETTEPESAFNQSIGSVDIAKMSSLSKSDAKDSSSVVDLHLMEVENKISDTDNLNLNVTEKMRNDKSVEGDLILETSHQSQVLKEGVWESDELVCITEPYSPGISEESCGTSRNKGGEIDTGTAGLSRLSGMGRAARRQFSAILDDFWGHFFDFHGNLTQQACNNKVDVLLGFNLTTSSRTLGSEALKGNSPEAGRGSVLSPNPRNYNLLNNVGMPNNELACDVQSGTSSWLLNRNSLPTYGKVSHSGMHDSGKKRYSSLHLPQYAHNWDYQPATVHGYQMSSYLRGYDADRLTPFKQPTKPNTSDPFVSNFSNQLGYSLGDGLNFGSSSSFEDPVSSGVGRLQDENPYHHDYVGAIYENLLASEKKYRSLPDISGRAISTRNSYLNQRNIHQGSGISPQASVGRMTFEPSQCSNLGFLPERAPLIFDEISSSNIYDISSPQSSSSANAKSRSSKQLFEPLIGATGRFQNECLDSSGSLKLGPSETSYNYLEVKLLKSLKLCIQKLLKLEGSDWLVRRNCGADEELINKLILNEKYQNESEYPYISEHEHCLENKTLDMDAKFPFLCKCGESCIWRAGLIVSFGVWCIRRILELCLVESRPELWGKNTYVLNRLQGILEIAFSRPRLSLNACPCIEIPVAHKNDTDQLPRTRFLQNTGNLSGARYTSSLVILEIVKDVELAISGRKGRMGTAAGDVAFPKGKENLASVLKRYKRRLSNKSPVTHQVVNTAHQ